ncbi:hypothetical protein Mpsy_2733 [Methanolobus psychrophilus R15]|nr:hypothetical protein Mpsy_2733 [Methanolobus psychrophilus R15]
MDDATRVIWAESAQNPSGSYMLTLPGFPWYSPTIRSGEP